jgi:hypothetical protein
MTASRTASAVPDPYPAELPAGACPRCGLDRPAAWTTLTAYRRVPGAVQWDVRTAAQALLTCHDRCGRAGGWEVR